MTRRTLTIGWGAAALLIVSALGFTFLLFSSSPELMMGGPFGFMTKYIPSPRLISMNGHLKPQEEASFLSEVDHFANMHGLRSTNDPLPNRRSYMASSGKYLSLDAHFSADESYVQINKDADDRNDYAGLVADLEQTFLPFGLHREPEQAPR